MKIRYYIETDSLYIELLNSRGTGVMIVNDDLRIDIDAFGNVIGIDIDNARKNCDTSLVETAGIANVKTLHVTNA